MSSISAFRPDTPSLITNGRTQQMLSNEDFMKLLITELTNQDPFEPMKNQDLLNQISSIQELESNQRMTTSFTGLVDRMDGFVNQFDSLIFREQMGSAGKMIGQLVSGTDTQGQPVFGKVTSITIHQGEVHLELDTGKTIKMDQILELGGTIDNVRASDMVGKLVIGLHNNGLQTEQVIGTVESIEVNETQVTLHLRESGSAPDAPTIPVAISSATVINEATADLMLGLHVKGFNGEQVEGLVVSYLVDVDGIKLVLADPLDPDQTGQTVLPLSKVTEITPSPGS